MSGSNEKPVSQDVFPTTPAAHPLREEQGLPLNQLFVMLPVEQSQRD